jgi:hypothetical protein
MENQLKNVIPVREAERFANYNKHSQIISDMYSYLGKKCLSGDVEALKYLYRNAWEENPVLIQTICELQFRLTSVDFIENTSVFSDEFLYYWGMVCLGEVSGLIPRDFKTAVYCFKKIKTAIPKANARLAYIYLCKTKEPAKSEKNIRRIETLRRWVKMGDLFSRIILSRIVFYKFLKEMKEDDPNPPILAVRVLGIPCQKGHPVALKFCEKTGNHLASIGNSNTNDMRKSPFFFMNLDPKDKRIAGFPVNPDTLLDI